MKAITRFSSPETNFGPLAYLQDTYVSNGHNGWNLMVVPQKTDEGTSFLVMIQQLYETQVFTRVGAPVPNRGGEVGNEQLIAVKYNQTAAENASKNILHEEVGMWIFQTPSDSGVPGWSDTSADIKYPILRQGVIPHGNSILLAGNYQDSDPAKPSYPSSSTAYLPKILSNDLPQDVIDAFMAAYKQQVEERLKELPETQTKGLTAQNFYNPTSLLDLAIKFEAPNANDPIQFEQAINLHVNAENAQGFGGIVSIPFARSYANPISFDAYLSIQVVKNTAYDDETKSEFDEVPNYFQLQYFQNIPIRFDVNFMGHKISAEFPHYQLNTLVKV